jgi:hypothetical protein
MKTYFDEFGNVFEEKNKKEEVEVMVKNENEVLNMGVFQSLEQQATMNMTMINQMKNLYNSMINMKDEVLYLKENVDGVKNEMKEMHKDVMDNVYLSQGQFSELYKIVHDATRVTVVGIYGELNQERFNKAFAKVVRRFWKLVKRHCESPSRACEIKRKDYNKAITYAKSLGVSTYIESCGKFGIPIL